MGAPKAPKIEYYDASAKQAEAASRGIELMMKGEAKAYESGRVSTLLGAEAVNRVKESVGLLGAYLKDRNLSVTNQIPLDAGYLQSTTDINTSYAKKATSLLKGGM